MSSCGLFHLGGVAGWEFWWTGEDLGLQKYVLWWISNFEDGIPVTCHSDL
jgi:hypothetical protein